MLASTWLDLCVGVDIHWEFIPTPAGPIPTPLPNPFLGVVFDPAGLAVGLALGAAIAKVTGAPVTGPVLINSMPATNAGTEATATLGVPHILIPPGTGWAPMPKTPKPVIRPGETPKPPKPVIPDNDAVVISGSKTVSAMGASLCRLGDLAMSCSEPVRLPSSTLITIPKGAPVLVGGPMSVSITDVLMASLRTRFISDSAHALISRMRPGRLRNLLGRAACFLTGHPVDVATGRMLTSFVDFELAGPVPLRFERSYNSSVSGRVGPLGHGWSHCLAQAVWRELGKVVHLAEDGREVEYDVFDLPGHDIAPGQSVYNPIAKATLRCVARDVFEIEGRDRVIHRFAPIAGAPGRSLLVEKRRRLGPGIKLSYDERGRLRWADVGGRAVRFDHDRAGRLTSVSLPDPHRDGWVEHTRYEYDDSGDLVRVIDPSNHTWTFEYVDHLLVRETERDGSSYFFAYDGLGDDAWCVRTWGDDGRLTRELVYDKSGRVTAVIDGFGHQTIYRMNELGLVVEVVNARGAKTSYEYDPRHLARTLERDPDGAERRFEYDARANVTAVTSADGVVELFEYDANDCAVRHVDSEGGVWTARYSAEGLPIEQRDPLGRFLRRHWDARGLLVQVDRTDGTTLRMAYDSRGQVTAYSEADEQPVIYERDRLGRVVRIRDPRAGASEYGYDPCGRPAWVRDAAGIRRSLRDPVGNVVEDQRADGSVLRFDYGPGHKPRAVIGPDGSRLVFEHDAELRLRAVVKASGERTEFEYDEVGNATSKREFDGARWTYRYDTCNRVKSLTRPDGGQITREYDVCGRAAVIDYGDGLRREYAYDRSGRLLSATSPDARIEYERDVLGRIICEHQDEHWIRSDWNLRGGRTQLESSLGAKVRVQWGTDDRPAWVDLEPSEHTRAWGAAFEHGRDGLERRRRMLGEVWAQWDRDAHGQPIRLGVATQRGDPLLGATWSWTSRTDLRERTDSITGTRRYLRDAGGGLRSVLNADDLVIDPEPDVFAVPVTELDELVEQLEVEYAQFVAYGLDGNGRRVDKRMAGGLRWRFEYDGADQLVAVTGPDARRVRYGYDALGRRTFAEVEGQRRRWLWDRNAVLQDWVDASSPTTWLFEPGRWTPLARVDRDSACSIICDHLGTPLALIDAAATPRWSARADRIRGCVPVDGEPARCPWRFPGQWADATTGLHYNRHRWYDPDSGEYLTPDPTGLNGGLDPWAYVPDPTVLFDPLGLESECVVLYHGTNDAGESAIRRGVDINAGRGNLDFDPPGGSGFYTTRDLAQAQEWAVQFARRNGGEPRVVEFRIPREEFDALDRRVFDMSNPADADAWSRQVQSSRMGDMQGMHTHDVMEGPMVGNPGKISRGADPNPVGTQTSFHTTEGAQTLDRNIAPHDPDIQPVQHGPPAGGDRGQRRGGDGRGRGDRGGRGGRRGRGRDNKW